VAGSCIDHLHHSLERILLTLVTHHCVHAADYQARLLPPQPLPPPLEQWRPRVLRQQGRRPQMLTLLAAAPPQPQTASVASAEDTAAALAGVLRALHAGEAPVNSQSAALLRSWASYQIYLRICAEFSTLASIRTLKNDFFRLTAKVFD
jgi:hypothetical protein